MKDTSGKSTKTNADTVFTSDVVKHISQLAQIPLKESEVQSLADGFTATMNVVNSLQAIDTSAIEPTSQVAGKVNTFRDDVVDTDRIFSHDDALQNAREKHDGYFVVHQVLDKD